VRQLLARVPKDLPAAIVAVLHTGPGSILADVLRSTSRLAVRWAQSGDLVTAGVAYVGQPGFHLIVNPDGRLTMSDAPRIRLFRPSADWLFESAAASFRDRHIAIVVSGRLTDGCVKLETVRAHGGTVLAQEPDTCIHAEMPKAAIATGHVNLVLTPEEMPAAIDRLLALRDRQADEMAWNDPFGGRMSPQFA